MVDSAMVLDIILTPWSRVLPEKLKAAYLVQKFPAFNGTHLFINVFIKTSH
jgi:hypothetical protein